MELSISLTYYDKLLLAMAVSLVAGGLTGALTSIQFHVGVFVGAALATLFLYDAIYRNPPLPEGAPGWKTIAVVWHLFLVGLLALVV